MSDFQREVGEWAASVFTQATHRSIVAHLRREVGELRDAVEEPAISNLAIMLEAADCYLLLLHLSHRLGMDLGEAARLKHQDNVGRRWGDPDAEGVVEHVR